MITGAIYWKETWLIQCTNLRVSELHRGYAYPLPIQINETWKFNPGGRTMNLSLHMHVCYLHRSERGFKDTSLGHTCQFRRQTKAMQITGSNLDQMDNKLKSRPSNGSPFNGNKWPFTPQKHWLHGTGRTEVESGEVHAVEHCPLGDGDGADLGKLMAVMLAIPGRSYSTGHRAVILLLCSTGKGKR